MALKHLHMQRAYLLLQRPYEPLTHTFERSETLEIGICIIGWREAGVGRFRPLGWEPAASGDAQAPPAPSALVGALSSVRDNMRRPNTCAQPPSEGAAGMGYDGEASRQRWVGKEAKEALRELREEGAWSA